MRTPTIFISLKLNNANSMFDVRRIYLRHRNNSPQVLLLITHSRCEFVEQSEYDMCELQKHSADYK
jgi:hypothetical protein